jgi:hypothetical protein
LSPQPCCLIMFTISVFSLCFSWWTIYVKNFHEEDI